MISGVNNRLTLKPNSIESDARDIQTPQTHVRDIGHLCHVLISIRVVKEVVGGELFIPVAGNVGLDDDVAVGSELAQL